MTWSLSLAACPSQVGPFNVDQLYRGRYGFVVGFNFFSCSVKRTRWDFVNNIELRDPLWPLKQQVLLQNIRTTYESQQLLFSRYTDTGLNSLQKLV